MSLSSEFIDILCCPKRRCRGNLKSVTGSDNQEKLECFECQTQYPIIDDIPIMFPNSEYSKEIHKRHWDLEPNAVAYSKKYDGYMQKEGTPWGMYTHVSELSAIKRLTKDIDLSGKTILDAGCGNGRLLAAYPEGKTKIGLDASFILLQRTKERDPSLWLVCGQLEDMPFKDAVADLSVSIRVFQHLKAPYDAFSEMTRVTKPTGYVSLEVYNKFNLKELYKRFRMLDWVNKIRPWGLAHDAYFSYRDIEKWCQKSFVAPIKYSGAGWGVHFYLLDTFFFRRFAPAFIQKAVYGFFLKLEDIVSTAPIFNKTLEKVCFIGSLQGVRKKKNLWEKFFSKLRYNRSVNVAQDLQTLLENRNFSLSANDNFHLTQTIDWIKKAQDATPDGGVSRGYSITYDQKYGRSGWQPSYPETTGYIIPTIMKAQKILNDPDLVRRAKLMAEWEMQIMLPNGSVQGGNITTPAKPTIFDSGQVIRGFLAMNEKKFLDKAELLSRFILENEKSGSWQENNASSVNQKTTTYNIYAIAPVVTLGKLRNIPEFINLGKRTADYTIKMQTENGQFTDCCFTERKDPLLHTIAYTIDGLFDIGDELENSNYKHAAIKALDGVLTQMDDKGSIPGRLDENWQATVNWACLTGVAQVAITCLKVYRFNKNDKYLKAATKAKDFLKTCQNNTSEENGYFGAVWGSWPISGEYGQYQALNWPAKYFADLLIDLQEIKSQPLQ